MTDSVLDLAKSYLSNAFVQQAASKLNESPEGITKALSATVPAIFAGIGQRASQDSSFMSTVLDKAKGIFTNGSSLNNLHNVVAQVPTDTTAPASNFVKSIFGNTVHNLTEKISSFAGIKQSSAHALLNASGVASLGSIGKDAVENNSVLGDIANFFKEHRTAFLSALPASLGLGSLFSHISYGAERVEDEVKTVYETEKKKSNFWVPLILALIVIALIIWVLMKACNGKPAVAAPDTTTMVVAPAPVQRLRDTIQLPGGTFIYAYKGGIEDSVVTFLQSPAYQSATENDLKGHWFSFDNITFKSNSATDLDTEKSLPQINNIIAILKAFPNAKIKIGGNTDRTGDSLQNMTLSQQRANTLRGAFSAVKSQVTGAEGYGWKYATYYPPTTGAPDSALLAKDRNMTLRFSKQ